MRAFLAQSNALKIPLVDKSVHCIITSPPYYGLRDYSVDGQLGLESTLQEYIDNTVLWCREVWRVLRDDGTFWLNLGDSYNGSGGPGSQYDTKATGGYKGEFKKYDNPNKKQIGFKPKDLMLVPHRVAIALQNDGWWIRKDIVWHKPNPMPESVKDRPTKSHEYIFLLTKSKKYYYDQDAIREANSPGSIERFGITKEGQSKKWNTKDNKRDKRTDGTKSSEGFRDYVPFGRNKHSVWTIDEDEFSQFLEWRASQVEQKKDVWTITTKPYKGAHFATFPPEIPEICIKAGTSEKGVCPVCGSQWARIVEASGGTIGKGWHDHNNDLGRGHRDESGGKSTDGTYKRETVGWKPTCSHNEEPIPATVLDPFGGSGTTAAVAKSLGHIGICMDLSWEYLQLAKERCGKVEYQYSF